MENPSQRKHLVTRGQMIKKIISSILVVVHIFTFGYVRDGLAALAESANYKLDMAVYSQGGGNKSSNIYKLAIDSIGQLTVGETATQNCTAGGGYLYTILSNPPIKKPGMTIPPQRWNKNESLPNALDLDDYFVSPDGLALIYSVAGNHNINVSIDSATHVVSFSQLQLWYGTETVIFTAIDTELNSCISDQVPLQVVDVQNAPIIEEITVTPANPKETDIITVTVKATDADNDDVTFSYSDSRFSEVKSPWKQDGAWYTEIGWKTDYTSAGSITLTVTATDTTGRSTTRDVDINIENVNRPPEFKEIYNKTDIVAGQILDLGSVVENTAVLLDPDADDPDNDTLIYSYDSPFDETSRWETNYSSANSDHTSKEYTSAVHVFDGRETVTQPIKITVTDVNRPAEIAEFKVNKYTLLPNEITAITLIASEPDGDAMTYILRKDSDIISQGSLSGPLAVEISFSSLGDHTLSAEVTESYGNLKTNSPVLNIDVPDPNADREQIVPIMGDFNGDALSDLGLHDCSTGKWEICLAQLNREDLYQVQFTAALDWLTDFGKSRDWIPMGGDFNGDGKTDIGIYNNTGDGRLQVALSTGSSFDKPTQWATFSGYSYEWIPSTGNFNGDKYTDFGLYNKNTGECKIALSSGSSFGPLTTWITNLGSGDYIPLPADYNYDGLIDLCVFQKSTGMFKVAFSNSSSFVDEATWATGFATDKDPIIADFNNDGLTDVGYWDKSSYNWYAALNTTTGFSAKAEPWMVFGSPNDNSAHTGDFNGDGITDIATFNKQQDGINKWSWHITDKKPTDLLKELNNGMGGKTQISYQFTSNPGLPFPVYTTSQVRLINTAPADRGATYTQNLVFEGGWFDATEREFRGFRMVKVTEPITGNYTETYFLQGNPARGEDGALKGQIEKILAYEGNGKPISQILNTWEVRKAGPTDGVLGFPYLKEVNSTVYEENDSSIVTRSKFKYDNLGNITEEISEGDLTSDSDNKIVTTLYNGAYLTGYNRPNETTLKDINNNLLSKKTFEYDDYGNLTKETAYSDGLNDPRTEYLYDSFGNIWKTTNALGYAVETIYESTFNTYPETITNKLGHQIKYEYNAKFGIVTKITDVNGQTTETVYDSLAKIVQQKNTQGQTVTAYEYPNFNTKITINQLTTHQLTKTEYIDGIGRLYKTVSDGEDGTQKRQVSTEVYFNNRGLKDFETLPHYSDIDPLDDTRVSYIRYTYDLRGRITSTTSDFPGSGKDATSKIYYDRPECTPLYSITEDPRGVQKGILKDVYGNTIRITEFAEGTYYTYYEYDLKGNLTKVTDNQGNITQIQYDRLGRKILLNDPDTGITTYAYDKLGNLLTQTDNKGNVITMEYDVLSRLVAKRGLSPQGTGPITLATYEYDDASKSNCKGRLSTVTSLRASPEGASEAISITSYYYDTEGRTIQVDKKIDSQIYTTQTTYDLIGRTTSITYPDNKVVYYLYNQNSGLLAAVSDTTEISGNTAVSDTAYVKRITHNASGQILKIKYGNNVETAYNYGQDLRLSQILTETPAQITPLQELDYTFDLNGNITQIKNKLEDPIYRTRTYNYDKLNRLIRAENVPEPIYGHGNFNYEYDPIGNMTNKSDLGNMTYPTTPYIITQQGQMPCMPHAVRMAGGYSYQYDANGNMTVGRNKTFEYDVENKLIQVNESGIITTFQYDADGSRIKKTASTGSTTYISSLFEKDSDGKTRKYIFAGSSRVATIESTGNTYYYHPDHLGSSNVITDATGQKVQYTEYTPYGTSILKDGTDVVKHKFTGKELDNTGLYYYGARYYDPVIARFTQPDSIIQAPFDPQTLNRYTYCRNNPLIYTDPTGNFFWIAVIFAAFFGAAMAASQGGGVGNILAGAFLGAWSAMCAGAVSQIIATAGGGAASQAIGGAFFGSLISGAATGARGRSLAQNVIISTIVAFTFSALGPAEGADKGFASAGDSQIEKLQDVVSENTAGGGVGDLENAVGATRELVGKGIIPQVSAERPLSDAESTRNNLSFGQKAIKALGIANAKTELFLWKIVHAPIHIAVAISEPYGPQSSPITVGLEYIMKSPEAASAIESFLPYADEFLENQIAGWEDRLEYWRNYGR
jgi:RHS repeat-associated protein